MTASIKARPAKPKDAISIGCAAPSRFIEAVREVFGDFPVTLRPSDGCRLEAMAAVYGGDDEHNPYQRLLELIDRWRDVEVWADY